jgi:tetratricopeptide (TPR) repeat protein
LIDPPGNFAETLA